MQVEKNVYKNGYIAIQKLSPIQKLQAFKKLLVATIQKLLCVPIQKLQCVPIQKLQRVPIQELPSVLGTIASHFLNFPPQNPTCNSSPECKSFPFKEFLSRLQVLS